MSNKFFIPLLAITAVCLFLLPGCVGVPDGIAPVSGFDINRYMGKWYEIARLDHRFERGRTGLIYGFSPGPLLFPNPSSRSF